MQLSIFLTVVLLTIFGRNDAHRPAAQTTSGHLKGMVSHVNNRPLMKFLGVPYAKTPVRFSRAEEFDQQQNETIDAGQFRPSCMQPPHLRKVIYRPLHSDLDDAMISEDCLNLNIYVPGRRISENKSNQMAVMVWLPGEGYDFGFANQYDGSRLAVHGNVIVVTVNYRLSVFGFLSTGDSQAPGNLGLSDQMMALKWLKKNVGQLGGDPERITIFGRLSGSMSISALMLSTAEGPKLFQRAILQSGIAHGEWTFENNPLEQTLLLANRVGCGQSMNTKVNTTRLINCLRKVPAKTLLKTAIRAPRPWRLTLDNQFLFETPLKRANRPLNAKIDVMLGTNEHEGSVCLLSHLAQNSEYMDKFLNNTLSNDDLRHLVHSHVDNYYGLGGDENLKSVIHNLYRCGNSDESLDNCRQQFISFCGDLYSHSAVTELADKLVKAMPLGNSVYRYEFSHRPTFSHYPDFVGAAQGDEVLFVFGLIDDGLLDNVTAEEVRLGHQMMTMWSNFAKTGNPNVFQKDVWWPRYNEHGEYLKITRRMSPNSIRKSTRNDRIGFWIDLNQNPATSTSSR